MLSNWELMRDFFGRTDLSGRPDAVTLRQISFGYNGTHENGVYTNSEFHQQLNRVLVLVIST